MLAVVIPTVGSAHDPIFGLGPHTLYKGGYEVHAGALREEAGDETETEYALALKYGITGDWVVGVEAPFIDLNNRWPIGNFESACRSLGPERALFARAAA